MSGVRPFFITGALVKIKLNGKTLAFCTNFTYSVEVITKTPKILGMYEGSSVEPLGYSVSGSFTLVRYAKDVKAGVKGKAPKGVAANDAGNGVGNWGGVWGGGVGDFLARNGIGNDGRANEALDPSKFANSTTFDIEVYQRIPFGSQNNNVISRALDFAGGGSGAASDVDSVGIAKIRNARITRADFDLSKKSLAQERFNFVALYLDGDGFVADYSGLGQQF